MALIDLPSPADLEDADDVPEAYAQSRYDHDSPFRRARLLNPAVLEAQSDYTERLLAAGPIDETLFEYVMVAVAQANECRYCTASHRKQLKAAADLSGRDLLAIAKEDYDALPERERAIMTVAAQLARSPHDVDESHIESLRSIGFSDADVVQLFAVVGWCSTANTIVTGLDITPADRADDISAYDELDGDG